MSTTGGGAPAADQGHVTPGDGEGVASLVEVLESVAEEIIPEITNTVMIAALCQGFRDINLPHKFFNILASSNLHKISD